MNFKPKKQGLTRLSESEQTRSFGQPQQLQSNDQRGRFCSACEKWHGYLKQSEALCRSCLTRLAKLQGK